VNKNREELTRNTPRDSGGPTYYSHASFVHEVYAGSIQLQPTARKTSQIQEQQPAKEQPNAPAKHTRQTSQRKAKIDAESATHSTKGRISREPATEPPRPIIDRCVNRQRTEPTSNQQGTRHIFKSAQGRYNNQQEEEGNQQEHAGKAEVVSKPPEKKKPWNQFSVTGSMRG